MYILAKTFEQLMLERDLTRPYNHGFPPSESSPDSSFMIVLESLAKPSIFPLFKAYSILSAIFTTSCAAELELSSQWG
jgi:hypothetical protein